MNTDPIEADVMPPDTQAVVVRDPKTPPPQGAPAITPQQSRIEAVADLTKTALAQAGTLKLTAEETELLTADFGDEDFRPGAGGKENLIYIEHAALRDRLNKVLGLGQWAIIVRETWNEEFKTKAYAGKPSQDGVRVYARAMLLVRGAYVGEAVGDMDYYPHNASQNYGDAFEGAKTAAFRRCAKEFGVGLQAWRKEWCEGWWQRKQDGPRKPYNAPERQASSRPAPQQNASRTPAQAAKPPQAMASEAAEKWKQYALSQTKKHSMEPFAYALAMEDSWLIPGVDKLEDVSAQKFPQNKDAFADWWNQVKGRKQKAVDEGGMPQAVTEAFDKAYLALPLEEPPKKEPAAPPAQARSVPPPINVPRGTPGSTLPDEWFLKFVVPIPHAGQKRDQYLKNPDTIGGLYEAAKSGDDEARKRLFGFAEHFEPKGWTNREGKLMPASDTDKKFRQALDEFMDWRKANGEGQEDRHPEDDDIPYNP